MPVITRGPDSMPSLVTDVLEIWSTLPEDRFLWSRGISCEQYQLLPKIMRDGRPADEVFEREGRLLTRFRQRSMPYWPSGYPQNDWEHLFAMQHYGLPTRLLDWSENLFVSACFALLDKGGHELHDGPCIPIIWCFDPVAWNRTAPLLSEFGDDVYVLTTADEDSAAYQTFTEKRRPKSPVAIFGSHNSERIVAQRGTFTVWGKETKGMEEVASPQEGRTMWALRLAGDRSLLMKHLQVFGFNETIGIS